MSSSHRCEHENPRPRELRPPLACPSVDPPRPSADLRCPEVDLPRPGADRVRLLDNGHGFERATTTILESAARSVAFLAAPERPKTPTTMGPTASGGFVFASPEKQPPTPTGSTTSGRLSFLASPKQPWMPTTSTASIGFFAPIDLRAVLDTHQQRRRRRVPALPEARAHGLHLRCRLHVPFAGAGVRAHWVSSFRGGQGDGAPAGLVTPAFVFSASRSPPSLRKSGGGSRKRPRPLLLIDATPRVRNLPNWEAEPLQQFTMPPPQKVANVNASPAGEASRSSVVSTSTGRPCCEFFASPPKVTKQEAKMADSEASRSPAGSRWASPAKPSSDEKASKPVAGGVGCCCRPPLPGHGRLRRPSAVASGATAAEEEEEGKVRLGGSGVAVTKLGIGAWSWGDTTYWNDSEWDDRRLKEAQEAFNASIDNGMTFFDTAEVYGAALMGAVNSESLLGDFIKARQQKEQIEVAVATKFAALPWRFGRGSVLSALKKSLDRLGLSSVELYQLHWPGIWGNEGYLDGLADAYEQGLVKAVGVSNYNEKRLRDAHARLKKRGVPLTANQVNYSLIYRTPEMNGVKEACDELGITLIAYSPIAQGVLTGKYTPENPPTGPRANTYTPEFLTKLQPLMTRIKEIGASYEKNPTQVSLNWLICQGNVVPIPGAKNASQAKEFAGALGWSLTGEEVEELRSLAREIKGIKMPIEES